MRIYIYILWLNIYIYILYTYTDFWDEASLFALFSRSRKCFQTHPLYGLRIRSDGAEKKLSSNIFRVYFLIQVITWGTSDILQIRHVTSIFSYKQNISKYALTQTHKSYFQGFFQTKNNTFELSYHDVMINSSRATAWRSRSLWQGFATLSFIK